MNATIASLESTVAALEATYETTRALLAEDFADPESVRDPSGRFILLDALTALVNAKAALAAAQA